MLRQIQAVRYATYPGDGFVLDLALNLTGAQTRPGDHRDQGMDVGKTKGKTWRILCTLVYLPSGNGWHSYWKWPFIVSFPIKHGDFPIVMLVYQRVTAILRKKKRPPNCLVVDHSWSWSSTHGAILDSAQAWCFRTKYLQYPLHPSDDLT